MSKERVPFSETKNPNAIEKLFCEPMSKFKPVFDDTMKDFFAVVGQLKKKDEQDFVKKFQKVCWFFPAIEKRLTLFDYKLSVQSQLLVASACKSVGNMVAMLTFIQYLAKKKKLKKGSTIDFDMLCTQYFPDGFPSPAHMSECWVKCVAPQKTLTKFYSDNLLDYEEAMQSICL